MLQANLQLWKDGLAKGAGGPSTGFVHNVERIQQYKDAIKFWESFLDHYHETWKHESPDDYLWLEQNGLILDPRETSRTLPACAYKDNRGHSLGLTDVQVISHKIDLFHAGHTFPTSYIVHELLVTAWVDWSALPCRSDSLSI